MRTVETLWQTFFVEVPGRKDIKCLQNTAGHTVSDEWYAERKVNTTHESRRITQAAANMIKPAEVQYRHNRICLLIKLLLLNSINMSLTHFKTDFNTEYCLVIIILNTRYALYGKS